MATQELTQATQRGSEELGLGWTLLTLAVAFALAATTLLDVFTTLIWYASGGVDHNQYTRQVIAVLGIDRWAIMRGVLVVPFLLLVILVPHFLPTRLTLRARMGYVAGVCLLTLGIIASQALILLGNAQALGWLR